MSIALGFWKYDIGEYLDNDEVYRRGINGLSTEGLAPIPTEDILSALKEEFADWSYENLTLEKADCGRAVITMSEQFIAVQCFDMDYEDINKIIDVMHDFALPLYDPALPQRFDTDIEI